MGPFVVHLYAAGSCGLCYCVNVDCNVAMPTAGTADRVASHGESFADIVENYTDVLRISVICVTNWLTNCRIGEHS